MTRNPLQLNAVVIIQLWAEAFWERRSDASPLEKNSFWKLLRNQWLRLYPRCYFSDHFNGCRQYDCVQVHSLDIRMLFYSFLVLWHKYRAVCPQGVNTLYCMQPMTLFSFINQVHTCTFQKHLWFSFSLCRWNVIGVQGSLLSYFTEPIYFSSLILGSLYHADHLSRAMYQRIADMDDFPKPFALNRPLLSGKTSQMNDWLYQFCQLFAQPCLFPPSSAGISNTEARQPGKAPNFSVNWTVGDQGLEIINATTGKDDLGRASHLCKHALFSRWVCLHAKVKLFCKGRR